MKQFLLNLFLPFENPNHPLYSPTYKEEEYDEEWDELSDTKSPKSYSRIAFYKPPTWQKWGDKWYKQYHH